MYVVSGVAVRTHSLTPVVIYRPLDEAGVLFERPAAEFLAKFRRELRLTGETDGDFYQRLRRSVPSPTTDAAPAGLDQDGNPLFDAPDDSIVRAARKMNAAWLAAQAAADSAVNPAHYQTGAVQPIDLIEALGDGPAFCRSNAMKYLARYERKNGVEDLRKAAWYVDRLIGLVEAADS